MDSPFEVRGKTILVTGASSGIGRQCCVAIATCGGRVVASGRDPTRLAETLRSLDGDANIALEADLTCAEQLSRMAGNVSQLDGVVHSAGVQRYFPLKFIPEEASREMMALNYEAPIFLIQSLLKNRRLSDSASIVFISSLAGLLGVRGNSIYSGTKAALIASARVMALELATRRIRVNCIAPGIVKTPMAQKMTTAISTEQMTEHEKLYPLGFGFPEDVANAAVFLLSSASRWITGQTLVLDGGFSCH